MELQQHAHHNCFENKGDIIRFFESIIENGQERDSETSHGARGFLAILKDFEFNFLLIIFTSIFPQANIILMCYKRKRQTV